jgi:hypothetical protein
LTWKPAVFVELFECAVLEYFSSKPDAATVLVSAARGDVKMPIPSAPVILIQVDSKNAAEEMVVHPTGKGADALVAENIGSCVTNLSIYAG